MAFSDPIVVSIGGVNTNFSRTGTFGNKSVYKTDAGDLTIEISVTRSGGGKSNKEARVRRSIRLNRTATVVNPVSLQNEIKSTSSYHVIDEPEIGFSDAQLIADVVSVCTFMTTGTNANTAKVLTDQT